MAAACLEVRKGLLTASGDLPAATAALPHSKPAWLRRCAPHGGGGEGPHHKHGDDASTHTGQLFLNIFEPPNLKMTAISNKPRWAARKVIMPNGKLSISMDVIRIKISRFFKNTARAPGSHSRAPLVLPRAQGHSSEVRASFVGRDPPGRKRCPQKCDLVP